MLFFLAPGSTGDPCTQSPGISLNPGFSGDQMVPAPIIQVLMNKSFYLLEPQSLPTYFVGLNKVLSMAQI
jgi:hypothetical protein